MGSILEDSSAWQLIQGLAQANAVRNALLALGGKHLGQPTPETLAALKFIKDPNHLTRMIERMLDVTTWDELLATP